jgi:hypothetical protein
MVSDATEPSRFFDAEDPARGEMLLQLQPDGSRFLLLRQFGYMDPNYDRPFIIPADRTTFRTDLASIPWFFAWLVPGLGTHLAAVLVHDALVVGKDEGKTHDGPDVDREEADRILRDAMASLGTPVVRRWLMWTAVIMATAISTLKPRWFWPTVVIGTLLAIGALGTVATLDLLDIWDVLPWMGERWWVSELAWGLAFAVAIPLLLSLLWGRLWPAGVIAGITLAFLLHVTAAVMAVYGLYWVVERLVSGFAEGGTPSVKHNLDEAA